MILCKKADYHILIGFKDQWSALLSAALEPVVIVIRKTLSFSAFEPVIVRAAGFIRFIRFIRFICFIRFIRIRRTPRIP
ncbi:hypothetical protein [Bacillus haynesii]|uniref:hypothetical protein n=1 Tax=Bacillus haynesii TaxID=1925021 RepID=UPI00227EDF6F|nr:hypothetical protein [Bacillus haynesii]MCY7998495.1 hypothetical protein [Bacillus haynesii]